MIPQELSVTVQKLMELLDKLGMMIDQVPPIEQPQRFGNQAFRTWYQKLKDVGYTKTTDLDIGMSTFCLF